MDAPLDELYFVWLYNQVGDSEAKDPSRTYWVMLKQLYCKEFVWLIPNDDNRVEDGKELRYEFVDQSGLNDVDRNWIDLGCSMLELLIALSRRLSFEAEKKPRDWFWHMLDNLDLRKYNDKYRSRSRKFPVKEVDEILDRVIWRTYTYNGEGGLFPLDSAPSDQRETELWYQLSAYVLEKV